ncbi:MAG: glutathione S-transferase family protein [Paracoccaceae bacterium]
MVLYGRNLSPFVRRVAIWLGLQGRGFEQRALAALDPANAEAIRAVNPVLRVPVLVPEDGVPLVECFAICDWLDETAPDHALTPAGGPERRLCLARIALASAAADKAVALEYEKNRRPTALRWDDWLGRLGEQVAGGLGAIEAGLPDAGFSGPGDARPDGGDVAAVCLHDFVAATNPWLLEPGYPKLAALVERANGLAPFAGTRPEA